MRVIGHEPLKKKKKRLVGNGVNAAAAMRLVSMAACHTGDWGITKAAVRSAR